MSQESALEYIGSVKESQELAGVKPADAVLKGEEAGFEFTAEEFQSASTQLFLYLHENRPAGELDDKELDSVAGGCAIGTDIKDIEAMQESVRNQRQIAQTAFQNFDQKSNQLFNLMSQIMKSMNKMRMDTTRNMM